MNQFVAIHYSFVDGNIFRSLSPEALKEYLVLRRYVNRRKDDEYYQKGFLATRLSWQTLQETTGLKQYQIARAHKELQEKKIIRIKRTGRASIFILGEIHQIRDTNGIIHPAEIYYYDGYDTPQEMPEPDTPEPEPNTNPNYEIQNSDSDEFYTHKNQNYTRIKFHINREYINREGNPSDYSRKTKEAQVTKQSSQENPKLGNSEGLVEDKTSTSRGKSHRNLQSSQAETSKDSPSPYSPENFQGKDLSENSQPISKPEKALPRKCEKSSKEREEKKNAQTFVFSALRLLERRDGVPPMTYRVTKENEKKFRKMLGQVAGLIGKTRGKNALPPEEVAKNYDRAMKVFKGYLRLKGKDVYWNPHGGHKHSLDFFIARYNDIAKLVLGKNIVLDTRDSVPEKPVQVPETVGPNGQNTQKIRELITTLVNKMSSQPRTPSFEDLPACLSACNAQAGLSASHTRQAGKKTLGALQGETVRYPLKRPIEHHSTKEEELRKLRELNI